MATFSVALPRLQGLARPTRRRSASGCSPTATSSGRRRRRRGRQHLLRDARGGARSRGRPPSRAARTHRRVYVTGCGANLAGDAFAGLPDNVVVVARPSEETPGRRRRRRRRDRLRPGRRAARPGPRVRQGPGRLQLLVRLLRHPARPRRLAQPPRGRGARARSRRRVEQGHREVVLTGINLGCYRDREAGYDLPRLVREAGATPGLARLRLSSIEVNHVDEELVAALRETPTVSPPPPRAAPVGRRRRPARDGPALHGRDVSAPARAARRLQPDDRRDRRLPRRGRARVRRARCASVARRRASRRCTSFPYSPRPGTRPPAPTRSRRR